MKLKLVKAHNVYFIVNFYPPCRMTGLTLPVHIFIRYRRREDSQVL